MVTHSTRAASHAGRVLFIKDGIVYHQLYRGNLTVDQFYQKIVDTLTLITTGGRTMRSFLFYPRLAVSGMRRNKILYVPYLLGGFPDGDALLYSLLHDLDCRQFGHQRRQFHVRPADALLGGLRPAHSADPLLPQRLCDQAALPGIRPLFGTGAG